MSSFQRMPREMLTAIFEPAVEEHPLFVLTITHVCRSFRLAALCSPTLWATFSVNVAHRNANDLVDHFLAHSGAVPLGVSVTCPTASTVALISQQKERVLNVVRAVRAQQRRLRSLELTIDTIDVADAAFRLFVGPAPELVHLGVIVARARGRSNTLEGLEHAFESCPKLRVLRLVDCKLPTASSTPRVDVYATVTSLTLDRVRGRLSDLTSHIQMVPNLRDLVCVRWKITAREPTNEPMVLQSLERLTLVDTSLGTTGLSIIRRLTTPALRRLRLSALFDGAVTSSYPAHGDDFAHEDMLDGVGQAVMAFLRRSGWPMLVALQLDHCEMPGIDLRHVLDHTPRLEELSLAGNIRIDLFQYLAGPSDAQTVQVPDLRILAITDVPLWPSWLEEVLDRREDAATRSACRQLEEVTVSNCPYIERSDRDRWSVMHAQVRVK